MSRFIPARQWARKGPRLPKSVIARRARRLAKKVKVVRRRKV